MTVEIYISKPVADSTETPLVFSTPDEDWELPLSFALNMIEKYRNGYDVEDIYSPCSEIIIRVNEPGYAMYENHSCAYCDTDLTDIEEQPVFSIHRTVDSKIFISQNCFADLITDFVELVETNAEVYTTQNI